MIAFDWDEDGIEEAGPFEMPYDAGFDGYAYSIEIPHAPGYWLHIAGYRFPDGIAGFETMHNTAHLTEFFPGVFFCSCTLTLGVSSHGFIRNPPTGYWADELGTDPSGDCNDASNCTDSYSGGAQGPGCSSPLFTSETISFSHLRSGLGGQYRVYLP